MPFGKQSEPLEEVKSASASSKSAISAAVEKMGDQSRDLSYGPSGRKVPPDAVIPTPTIAILQNRKRDIDYPLNMSGTEEETPPSPAKKSKLQHDGPEVIKSRPTTSAKATDKKECFQCHTTATSTWRRDIAGNLICNKCGLRKRKDHQNPSRRLVDRNREKTPKLHGAAYAQAQYHGNHQVASPNESHVPLLDPRPPRPWITQGQRVSASASLSPQPASIAVAQNATLPGPVQGTAIPPAEYEAYLDAQTQGALPPANVVPSRRRGPKKAVNPQTMQPKTCTACGTDESPAWRKGHHGEPLCNKCMLRQKRADQRASGQFNPRASKTGLGGVNNGGYYHDNRVSSPSYHGRQGNDATRTESQIALNQFTHLNSSFASDSGTPTHGTGDMRSGHSFTPNLGTPIDPIAHPGHISYDPRPESGSESDSKPWPRRDSSDVDADDYQNHADRIRGGLVESTNDLDNVPRMPEPWSTTDEAVVATQQDPAMPDMQQIDPHLDSQVDEQPAHNSTNGRHESAAPADVDESQISPELREQTETMTHESVDGSSIQEQNGQSESQVKQQDSAMPLTTHEDSLEASDAQA